MDLFTVKELAIHMGKSEGTIKRWISLGRFPNAYLNSDKEGWRIPKQDLLDVAIPNALVQLIRTENDGKSFIKTAYEAVTLETPNEETLNILTYVGMKRALDILLLWRKCTHPIEISTFIRQAITEGWSTLNQQRQ